MMPRCLVLNQQNQLFFVVGKAASFPQHVIFVSPPHQHVRKWKVLSRFSTPTPTAHLDRAWNFSFLSFCSVNFHFPTKTAIKLAIFAKKILCTFLPFPIESSLISFNQSPTFAIFGSCWPKFSDSEGNFVKFYSRVFKWEFPQKVFVFFCSLIFVTIFHPENPSELKLELCQPLSFRVCDFPWSVILCRFLHTGNKKKKKVQRRRERSTTFVKIRKRNLFVNSNSVQKESKPK